MHRGCSQRMLPHQLSVYPWIQSPAPSLQPAWATAPPCIKMRGLTNTISVTPGPAASPQTFLGHRKVSNSPATPPKKPSMLTRIMPSTLLPASPQEYSRVSNCSRLCVVANFWIYRREIFSNERIQLLGLQNNERQGDCLKCRN